MLLVERVVVPASCDCECLFHVCPPLIQAQQTLVEVYDTDSDYEDDGPGVKSPSQAPPAVSSVAESALLLPPYVRVVLCMFVWCSVLPCGCVREYWLSCRQCQYARVSVELCVECP